MVLGVWGRAIVVQVVSGWMAEHAGGAQTGPRWGRADVVQVASGWITHHISKVISLGGNVSHTIEITSFLDLRS